MTREIKHGLLLAIGILVSTGCAGYDRILFATKTNVGLDIDDKPPTAEITIARRELAIAPTFQDAQDEEKTLPLLASFALKGSFLNPEITSRFAGGNAALILARGPDRPTDTVNQSSLCLSKTPDTRSLWKVLWQPVARFFFGKSEEDTRAFYFATDTAFGLKAAWDGTTGPYPSTVKLGYNRKELAFPPVFATADRDCTTSTTPQGEVGSRITVPSFVATLDNSSTLKEWFASGTTHTQFFATGHAASDFVKRKDVNSALNKAMYPRNDFLIIPETVALTVGGTQTFQTAGGKGQVRFTPMHDPTISGTIDPATGIYTAKTTPGAYAIGAADSAGNTAIAVVTVYPQLAITPTSHDVVHGKTLQFTATGGVPPRKFIVSDNQSAGATIDENGLYTAGNSAGKTDKVKVTDSSSPPKSVEATVTVK